MIWLYILKEPFLFRPFPDLHIHSPRKDNWLSTTFWFLTVFDKTRYHPLINKQNPDWLYSSVALHCSDTMLQHTSHIKLCPATQHEKHTVSAISSSVRPYKVSAPPSSPIFLLFFVAVSATKYHKYRLQQFYEYWQCQLQSFSLSTSSHPP